MKCKFKDANKLPNVVCVNSMLSKTATAPKLSIQIATIPLINVCITLEIRETKLV